VYDFFDVVFNIKKINQLIKGIGNIIDVAHCTHSSGHRPEAKEEVKPAGFRILIFHPRRLPCILMDYQS
jgi:hypothetical protein